MFALFKYMGQFAGVGHVYDSGYLSLWIWCLNLCKFLLHFLLQFTICATLLSKSSLVISYFLYSCKMLLIYRNTVDFCSLMAGCIPIKLWLLGSFFKCLHTQQWCLWMKSFFSSLSHRLLQFLFLALLHWLACTVCYWLTVMNSDVLALFQTLEEKPSVWLSILRIVLTLVLLKGVTLWFSEMLNVNVVFFFFKWLRIYHWKLSGLR